MLYSKLYPFQKEIVDRYKSLSRLGLFLDMGLGKTITSLAFAEEHKSSKIIVVSIKAKSHEHSWIRGSFAQHLDDMNFSIFNNIDKKKKSHVENLESIPNSKQSVIVNYHYLLSAKGKDRGQLPKVLESFIKDSKGEQITIIFDESHKLKNSSSSTSKIAKKLINLAFQHCNTKLYLLTGTPFTQGFIDLHNQLSLLGMPISKTLFITKFAIRGTVPNLFEWQQPIVGYKNLEELFTIVGQYSITELTEKNIKLPKQVFNDIIVPQTKEFEIFNSPLIDRLELIKYLKNSREVYETEYELLTTKKVPNPLFRNFAYPDDKYFAGTSGAHWLRTRQLSIGFQGNDKEWTLYDDSRLVKLREFLEEVPENFVIFYNYTPELDMLYTICDELGYKIDVYSGSIKSLNYYNEYEGMDLNGQFNASKRVIIANFASGGTGVNWQSYNHCIFFSIPTYGIYAQSLKRCHRIGQKKPVYYYMFSQDNFLDKGMIKALREGVEYNENMFNFENGVDI